MSLATIKDQLYTNLRSISGVQRVYPDLPDLAIAGADCPAIVLNRRDPFLTVTCPYNDTVEYVWHFVILFVLKPTGLGTISEWDDGIEPYPARLIAQIASDLTLGGYAKIAEFSGDVRVGIFELNNTRYFGFEWNLDVVEQVTTSMVA